MGYVDVVIETPKGSAQKYDYDPDTHFFKLKKILPSGMVFPYDFGFVPDTRGEDGDPLGVIVISEFHSFLRYRERNSKHWRNCMRGRQKK
jgi:inorganic pyrophosphatase